MEYEAGIGAIRKTEIFAHGKGSIGNYCFWPRKVGHWIGS